MVFKTVQPVDRLSRVTAVARYAENRKPHDERKRGKGRPPNQNQQEEPEGDKFYVSAKAKEQPEEFGALLKKLVEENRQMKETAKTIYPADRGTDLAVGTWAPRITVSAFTKE